MGRIVDYDSRKVRLNNYIDSIDWNIDKLPDIIHTFCVNWQGSGKDIYLNADIFSMYFYGKSIIDFVYSKMLNRPNYVSKIVNLYANCDLNKEVYGDDYTRIDKVKEIKDCSDGVLYLNDGDRWFNSRGYSLLRADEELLSIVDNARKDGLILRSSVHRYMNIDVKLRKLVPVWVFPDLLLRPNSDMRKLNNYLILAKIVNSVGKMLCNYPVDDLPLYVGLYNTLEKSLPISKEDL